MFVLSPLDTLRCYRSVSRCCCVSSLSSPKGYELLISIDKDGVLLAGPSLTLPSLPLNECTIPRLNRFHYSTVTVWNHQARIPGFLDAITKNFSSQSSGFFKQLEFLDVSSEANVLFATAFNQLPRKKNNVTEGVGYRTGKRV